MRVVDGSTPVQVPDRIGFDSSADPAYIGGIAIVANTIKLQSYAIVLREAFMITPIILLLIMTAPYGVTSLWSIFRGHAVDRRGAGAIGLGLLFVFTGVGHFHQTEAMAQMLPAWVPERFLLVYLTGLLEFAIAFGFFIPRYRRVAGQCAALVLILFFPANIYAAWNHVPMGGHAWGPVYLLIRAPLQLAILGWTWWFTIRQPVAQHGWHKGMFVS
jgi:uncharacterized membrane protein